MSILAAAQPADKHRTGKVNRIGTFTDATYIRLNIPSDTSPLEDLFVLRPDAHRNYNAMYSLVLVAATNQYNLKIRTSNSINKQAHGEVQYMYADFPPT